MKKIATYMIIFFLLFCSIACGKTDNKKQDENKLILKNNYETIYKSHVNNVGFIALNFDDAEYPFIDKVEFNINNNEIDIVAKFEDKVYVHETYESTTQELKNLYVAVYNNDENLIEEIILDMSLMSFYNEDLDNQMYFQKQMKENTFEDDTCSILGSWCFGKYKRDGYTLLYIEPHKQENDETQDSDKTKNPNVTSNNSSSTNNGTTNNSSNKNSTTSKSSSNSGVTNNSSSNNSTNNETVKDNSVSLSKQNALRAAKDYLKFSAFSRDGLIAQLEYEKYSHEDAVYAVDHCGANWREQAQKSAKDYLKFSSFSRKGLIKQLEYEKYSHEDAIYAVDHCGANWNEQAAKTAKDYLKSMPFSRQSLIEQLEYEGFTHDQAVYGVNQAGL